MKTYIKGRTVMKTILVCLDFTDITDSVIEEACSFASKTGAALHLVYVSPYRGEHADHVASAEAQTASIALKMTKENQKMESCEARCREQGVSVDGSILSGNVSDAIVKKAKDLEINYIIIGSRTTNAATHVIKGSIGADLLKKLKKPLLLVPHK